MDKLLVGKSLWPRVVIVAVALVMAAVSFLFTSKPVAAQTTFPCETYHIVQPGEYVAKIARIYGVTPQAILAYNPEVAARPNLIYPGQVIKIPLCGQAPPWVPPPQPVPPTTPPPGTGGIPTTCRYQHYVQPGQTLSGIGRYYGVDPWTIAAANGIYNLNLIFSGSTLCIP